jgi:hypothetical protein
MVGPLLTMTSGCTLLQCTCPQAFGPGTVGCVAGPTPPNQLTASNTKVLADYVHIQIVDSTGANLRIGFTIDNTATPPSLSTYPTASGYGAGSWQIGLAAYSNGGGPVNAFTVTPGLQPPSSGPYCILSIPRADLSGYATRYLTPNALGWLAFDQPVEGLTIHMIFRPLPS